MKPTDPFDSKHIRYVEAYAQQVAKIYAGSIGRLARIGSTITLSPDEVFKYSKQSKFKAQFNSIFSEMAENLNAVVLKGIKQQWDFGDEKAISEAMYKLKGTVSPKAFEKIASDNFGSTAKALDAFLSRKDKGLGLSDKIWNYTNQFKGEMELALQLCIREGKSAGDLAIEMQKYLREPEKLFRRVADEFGNLHLSKSSKKYSPGLGVYRSSYKNALRLTRTEINMAYRSAENERYRTIPFIVGFEVRLSNAHPAVDICDDLKGKYPKSFIYRGWHPQCLCHSVPIFATDSEFETLEEQILSGESISPINSQNAIKSVPKGFSDWIDSNKERSQGWKSQPYFIRDNFREGNINGGLKVK